MIPNIINSQTFFSVSLINVTSSVAIIHQYLQLHLLAWSARSRFATLSAKAHGKISMKIHFLTPVCVCALRGVGPGCNTREIADKLIDLKAELDDLAVREHELDQQRVWVQQSIKNVTDDSDNSPYPFLHVTRFMVKLKNFFTFTQNQV